MKNPVKAIRAKCLDCSGGSRAEVNACVISGCPLFPFRMGTNPFRKKRILTEETRSAAIARLAASRQTAMEETQ